MNKNYSQEFIETLKSCQ